MDAVFQTIHTLKAPGLGAIAAGDPGGTPVIFLHGWGGSKEVWAGMLRRCPPGYFFVSLDLPGTGGSANATYTDIAKMAGWVMEKAATISSGPYTIVGHSMGGNVACHCATFHPDAVCGMVLVAPALSSDKIVHAKPYLSPRYGRRTLACVRYAAGLLNCLEPVLSDGDRGGYWRPWIRRNGYVARHNRVDPMLTQIKALTRSPIGLTALSPDLPVLCVLGRRDSTVRMEHVLAAMSQRKNNTVTKIYNNAHHCPMDQFPERFSGDLREFLALAARAGEA